MSFVKSLLRGFFFVPPIHYLESLLLACCYGVILVTRSCLHVDVLSRPHVRVDVKV